MEIKQRNQHDYRISMIRLISVCLIITCHLVQEDNMRLAEWLNVGVQIFLSISGYLYGKRQIKNIIQFYIKRVKKLLLPYYLVVVAAAIANYFFANETFDLKHTLSCLAIRGVFDGVQQLWFIPNILMCYLLTPLFQNCMFYTCDQGKRAFIFVSVFVAEIITVTFMLFAPYYSAACIVCYFLGYVIGFNEKTGVVEGNRVILLFTILATQNILQILFEPTNRCVFSGTLLKLWNTWSAFNHVWLGVFIFLTLLSVLGKINFENNVRLLKALNISDSYSMELFYVHALFIVGPLSLMHLTSSKAMNILIVLAIVALCSVLLKYTEVFVLKVLNNHVVKRKTA